MKHHILKWFKYTIYLRLIKLRAKIITWLWSKRLRKIGKFSTIYPDCIFADARDITLGHHVFINSGAHFYTAGSKIDIGNYVLIGPNCSMLAANRDYSEWRRPMYFGAEYIKKPIKIEDDVWIGENVIITAGVTIHRGAVVAAGSVVTKDIPTFAIAGGVPSKVIKYRFDNKTIKKALKIDLSQFANQPKDKKHV